MTAAAAPAAAAPPMAQINLFNFAWMALAFVVMAGVIALEISGC